MNTLEFYQQQLATHRLPGSQELRQQAMDKALAFGWPTKIESWKYTRSTPFQQQTFALAEANQTIAKDKIGLYLWPDCYHAVFYQGKFQPVLSSLPTEITVDSLAVSPMEFAIHAHSAFTLLNDALWQDGLNIAIEENAKLAKPLQILVVDDGDVSAQFLKFHIRAGKKSEANIILHALNLADTVHVTNISIDTTLADSAKVNLLKIHDAKNAMHFVSHHVSQAEGSELSCGELTLSNQWLRNEITVDLLSEHAQCNVFGFYLAQDHEHIDHHLVIRHHVAHGTSKQFFKGIATGHAKAIFTGKVIVDQGAQKTDAEQHNQCLLLSSTAEIDTKPELEIYANDVKCAHGAAVGQLPEDELFYLMARGIGEAEAKKMLMQAFAHGVFEKIEWLQSAVLMQLIDERLSCLT